MLKAIAWICIIGLAVASWTPGQEMVRTGFNTRLEHTLAYLIAGHELHHRRILEEQYFKATAA